MNVPSAPNPLDRFTGLAGLYARCRPDYPTAAIDFIVTCASLNERSLLVDVGCGTGISSRLFAARGVPVVGIEPNDDMRTRAEAEPVPPGRPAPRYRKGTGEATGLADACADAVLAAQAFHWFAPEAALREFHRILRPDAWAVLMWNERDERDPFTAAYGAVLRTGPDAARVETNRGQAGEALLVSPLFHHGERATFAHAQKLDEGGLLGRALSASYAPREPAAVERFTSALRGVFGRFACGGKVALRYETALYLAQRRDGHGA